MNSCRLLYLEADQLTAFAWQRGQLVDAVGFAPDGPGLDNFRGYLAAHHREYFHWLVNSAEESYRQETIPFLWGADRQALIERKSRQHFAGPVLRTSLSLGHEKTRRKNEKLLLAAFTAPDRLQPWQQAISESEVALSGIYSVTQLAGALLQRLGHPPCDGLLLCQFGDAIRESHLLNGQTVFSRLVAIGDRRPEALAEALVSEAGKLQQYLLGQRQIGREDILPVYVIAQPAALQPIRQGGHNRGTLAFTVIDLPAAADRLKLKTGPDDNSCARLYLHLLAQHRPRQQFADSQLRHNFRLAQIRQALIALSLGTLLSATLLAASNTYRSTGLNAASRQLASREADLQRRYREIAATFPQLAIDHPTLRHLTDRQATLLGHQGRLGASLQRLSEVMDQVAAIELESLDWRLDLAPPGPAETPSALPESLALSGFIRSAPATGLATLEQFIGLLRAQTGCTVDLGPPLLATAASLAQSASGAENNPAEARPFSLRITRQSSR
ncbi:MAG: hypothetical protein H6R15_1610 [Proteobacteria bacterium]|nr:hypothetical protein [Pseudomonadota bacterium]